MSNNENEPPNDELSNGTQPRPWFRPNKFGPGWHPSSWQGGLIIAVIVVAITSVVVLLKTGVL